MFNLQEKYEKILKNIPDFGESFKIEKEIEKCILDGLDDLKKKSKIIIRGGGVHTEEFLKFIEQKYTKEELDIIAIVDDAMQGRNIEGISVISKQQAEKLGYKQVIISSFSYADEMYQEYNNSKVNVWNLYNNLSKKGYNLDAPFYCYKEGSYEIPLYYINIYINNKSKKI